MRIMCTMCKKKRYCIKYVFCGISLSILVSLYIVTIRHNIRVKNRFHLIALRAQTDKSSNLQRNIGLHSNEQRAIGLKLNVQHDIHSNMQDDTGLHQKAHGYLNVQRNSGNRQVDNGVEVKMMSMLEDPGSQSSEVGTIKMLMPEVPGNQSSEVGTIKMSMPEVPGNQSSEVGTIKMSMPEVPGNQSSEVGNIKMSMPEVPDNQSSEVGKIKMSMPEVPDNQSSEVGTGKRERLDVYIVDEHHEVIPYWFEAAHTGIIPKSGNTLVHIDGHADLAPPLYVPGYPFFRYPKHEQLKYLMQTNDAFIQTAAMAGLVNRLIWVWPSWDNVNHDDQYIMSTLSLGWMSVKDSIERAFCMCMKNETTVECITLTDTGINTTSMTPEADEGFPVPRNNCFIKKIIIVEEIHENKALHYFGNQDWIAKSENIILDIDEDFYGCTYAIKPLLNANFSFKDIKSLDGMIKAHLCPITTIQENESDIFVMDLISVMRIKRTCNLDLALTNTTRCQKAAHVHQQFTRQLNKSVINKTIHKCSGANIKNFLHNLILKLSRYRIKQLIALQMTGFCSTTSPKTLPIYDNKRFGICYGANTPMETAILEHEPSGSEIVTRSILLNGLYKKLNQYSPKLVTISRSMRDGYTPRMFFEQIEKNILAGLNTTLHRQIKVHYDKDLLGGKSGWPARHNDRIMAG